MREICITDDAIRDLEALGISRSQWTLEQLIAAGFTFDRPVHYRYDASLGRTRIYQYEHAPDLHAAQQDYDSELSSDADWDLACEMLVEEMRQCPR